MSGTNEQGDDVGESGDLQCILGRACDAWRAVGLTLVEEQSKKIETQDILERNAERLLDEHEATLAQREHERTTLRELVSRASARVGESE